MHELGQEFVFLAPLYVPADKSLVVLSDVQSHCNSVTLDFATVKTIAKERKGGKDSKYYVSG